ncbi:MAG: hypothetical protein RBT41_04370 [Clostridia bacterium]|jgi:hypothetical protein|nr:hypothetical protein [Clostridia bacterium]
MADLTRRFRGLRKNEVDRYLEELEKSHNDDIAGLEKQLEETLREKEALNQCLLEVQEEWANKSTDVEALELALTRLEETKGLLLFKAAKEAEEKTREARVEHEKKMKKIIELNEEITVIRQHIHALLDSMKKIYREPQKAVDNHVPSKIISFEERSRENKNIKTEEKQENAKYAWLDEYKLAVGGTAAAELFKKVKSDDKQQFDKMMEDLAKALHTERDKLEVSLNRRPDKEEYRAESSYWSEVKTDE